MNKLLIILLLLCGSMWPQEGMLYAQKRVLGKPVKFKNPVDKEGFQTSNTREKDKNSPWVAIADRSTMTYKSPNTKSEKAADVKFKESFYVTEEKGSWVRIAKAKLSSGTKVEGKAKDYGWIEKSKILLWTTGLTDEKTKINKKAFLLNSKADIKRILKLKKKEIVSIYQGPETGETIGEKTIYEFYFVFKKENDRYLLSKEVGLVNGEDLIGWVLQDRLEECNTRICLEPNFRDSAYLERQENDQFRLCAYQEETAANKHAEDGTITLNKVEWDNDPIKIDRKKMRKYLFV